MSDQDQVTPSVRSLREAQARLDSLFRYHPHGVFSLDLVGCFTALNGTAQAMCGYTEDELIGTSFADLVDPRDLRKVRAAFADLLRRQARTIEVRFRRRDLSVGEVEIIGLPIVVDDEVIGIYGLAEDVTERRRAQLVIDEAHAATRQASEAKSRFFASMSHEIRTPLTSILASAELIGDTELDPHQRRILGVMERSGQRLLWMVDEILDFSRLEAGGAELSEEEFVLGDVVDEIVVVVGNGALAKGLDLRVFVDPDLGGSFYGDPERLSHVLGNLVGNAVKFTPSGQISIEVTRDSSLGQGDTGSEPLDRVGVRIVVRDSGIGMTPEQQRLAFNSFQQADSSITRTYGGSGLGLSIVRELVDLMGGSVSVESALGQGSAFTVLIPLCQAVVPAVEHD